MKYCVFCAVAGFAAASYGWGLDSALKAVDKAAATVNEVNDSLKSSAQKVETVTTSPKSAMVQPHAPASASAPATSVSTATASPAAAESTADVSAGTLEWDAAGYQAKVAKVNAAMPEVMKKMPLRGEQEQWYDAAYQLTIIDRNSSLPPEQRMTRVDPNTRSNIDEFLSWVDGGMQTAASANQTPKGVSSVSAGYSQPQTYAEPPKQGVATAEASDPNDPIVEGSRLYDVKREIDGMIFDAKERGYPIVVPEWAKSDDQYSVEAYKGKRYSEIEKMKAEIRALIDAEKAKFMAVANEALQKKVDERKALIGKCDDAAKALDESIDKCRRDRDALFLQCSQALLRAYPVAAEKQYKSYADFVGASTTDKEAARALKLSNETDGGLDAFLKKQEESANLENYEGTLREEFNDTDEQKFITRWKHAKDDFLGGKDNKYSLDKKFVVQEKVLPGELKPVSGEAGYSEKDLDDDISALQGIESVLKDAANQCRVEAQKMLSYRSNKVAEVIGRWIDRTAEESRSAGHIDMDFYHAICSEKFGEPTLAKVDEIATKLLAEIAKNKKISAERENLIKKLAASDVSTWLADLEKYPKGEKRDAVFGDVLSAKFGSNVPKGKDLEGIKTLVPALYSKEQQQELLKDNKTPLSMIIAIASADHEIGKRLLKDDTDWAFMSMRGDAGEQAYLALLAQETDVDVLMAVYEKQDRIKFTYEANAKKSGEMTAGDHLEKMWKDNQNNNGGGYGRLGLWMLDNCGKEFCKRVEKLTDARRKVAKGQTFLMKDYYLGMPHRDSKLVMKNWDKKKGSVKASFGTFNNGTLSEISFGAKARCEYLGISKDGLKGLGQFVEKYIPGGMESVGELKVGAKADLGYDPENPEVEIKTWWYTDCPKYDCRIRMYDSGTICVAYTGDEDSPKLDFSNVK